MSTLQELSTALTGTVQAVSKYVVSVQGGSRFGASGVIWQPGVAVTTRSTLRKDENLRVALADGNSVPATLAAHDAGTDLAVLRFDGSAEAKSALDSTPELGQLALAVGRSENTGVNASLGIVSAVGKPWQTWQGGKLDSYIRLDLTLYPGTSGAAVVNTDGALIGLASGVLSRIAPLAIPSSTIDRVVGELLARGTVARPWLGVGVQPVPIPSTLAEAANSVTQGLVVLTAEPETPAGKGGLLVGDILLTLDGVRIGDPMDLRGALARHSPSDSVKIVLLRGGERKELSITLAERPGRSRP